MSLRDISEEKEKSYDEEELKIPQELTSA